MGSRYKENILKVAQQLLVDMDDGSLRENTKKTVLIPILRSTI